MDEINIRQKAACPSKPWRRREGSRQKVNSYKKNTKLERWGVE